MDMSGFSICTVIDIRFSEFTHKHTSVNLAKILFLHRNIPLYKKCQKLIFQNFTSDL